MLARLAVLASCLFSVLTSLGCGGDSGGLSLKQGQLIDGPVSGVAYKTKSRSGTTDAGGIFYYIENEEVSFSLGSVSLGRAPGAEIITPFDLILDTGPPSGTTAINITRFLLCLDLNGNPGDGITIPDVVVGYISGFEIDFTGNMDGNTDINGLLGVLNSRGVFTDGNHSMPTESEAADHLAETFSVLGGSVSYTLWYADTDSDSHGDSETVAAAATQPAGYVADRTDCDDTESSVYSGAAEIPGDGIDQDCDGSDLQTWYRDADSDGYGDAASSSTANSLPTGYVADSSDCDDNSDGVYPGASETPDDTIDQDCDGSDLKTWYRDTDNDNYGNAAISTTANTAPDGYVADNTDTDDADIYVNPGIGPLQIITAAGTETTGVEDSTQISVTVTATGGVTPYTWTVAAGSLPPGLALQAASGTVSGTATTAGSFPVTIRVTDTAANTETVALAFTIHSKFVLVENGKFRLHGDNWYPFGVNYYPHYAVNPPAGFTAPTPDHWLASAYYDSTVVEQDLATLEAMGINCVSTRASRTQDTWAALTDFLARCLSHNIRVFLSVPAINPLKPELYTYDAETAIDEMITTLNLDEHAAIFAYDIAYEPQLGAWGKNDGTSVYPWLDNRSRYDWLWSRFIDKEYGGEAAAEIAFGRQLDESRATQAAGIVSHNLPTRAVAGQIYACTVTLKNMGTNTWKNSIANKHMLAWVLGAASLNSGNWVDVPGDVAPGATVSFNFNYTAPAAPERQKLVFSVIQLNVAWFGSLVEWEVEVVAAGGIAVQKVITYPASFLGPTDDELTAVAGAAPADDALVYAFRRFLDTHTATSYGHVVRHLREMDPNHLISCRQGWGGNGSSNHTKYYPLELRATAHHFDFLGPENYEFMFDTVSNTILSGSATTEAYSRWASNGKPVLWTEAAYIPMLNPTAAHNQEQATYFDLFIDHMLTTRADGVLYWWWPGGTRDDENSDFGVTDQNGNLRPAGVVLQTRAAEATGDRPLPQAIQTGTVNLFTGPSGYEAIYKSHRPNALATYQAGKRYVMLGDGDGTTSAQAPATIAGLPKHLWADISRVELKAGSGDWFEVRDGHAYVVPANTAIQARAIIVNMGDTSWLPQGSGAVGDVYFSGNENFGLQFRHGLTARVDRLNEVTIEPFTMTSGINADTVVQFQMLAENVTWISGALRIQLFPQ